MKTTLKALTVQQAAAAPRKKFGGEGLWRNIKSDITEYVDSIIGLLQGKTLPQRDLAAVIKSSAVAEGHFDALRTEAKNVGYAGLDQMLLPLMSHGAKKYNVTLTVNHNGNGKIPASMTAPMTASKK